MDGKLSIKGAWLGHI